MDLSSLRPSSRELVINDRYGRPTDMVWTVVGTESKPFREAVYEVSREQMKRQAAADVEQTERDTVRLLAACVIGWRNVTENGVDVPFSRDAVYEVLINPEFKFIREQVDAFASMSENFFPRSDGQVGEPRPTSSEAGDDGQAGGQSAQAA